MTANGVDVSDRAANKSHAPRPHDTDFARAFAPARTDERSGLQLADGSRVAVVGGGPAGSFFAIFLAEAAARAHVDLDITVFETRDFTRAGPAGCNMCGGIVSEYLVQTLAADGIRLPEDVVERGVDTYELHTPEGDQRIVTTVAEARIAAMHRGGGPKRAVSHPWRGFDEFLLSRAAEAGARVIHERVTDADLSGDLPTLTTASGVHGPFDLVTVACGVNSPAMKLFAEADPDYEPPTIGKAYTSEIYVGREWLDEVCGSRLHIYLLNEPGLEFGALIPKAEHYTLVLVGPEMEDELVERFLARPEVQSALPHGWSREPVHCQCKPKLPLVGPARPYGDRLLYLGDAGVNRLYKDGIGGSYRTAKVAATTAMYEGVSAQDFGRAFHRVTRSIRRDNRYGRLVFAFAAVVQHVTPARWAMLQMVASEQSRDDGRRPMSSVLWDMFSGTAPYRDVFFRSMGLRFLGGFLGRTATNVFRRPSSTRTREAVRSPQPRVPDATPPDPTSARRSPDESE